MKRTSRSWSRTASRGRPVRYRPQMVVLEDRLPLGDALLSALLGSYLLGPSLAPANLGVSETGASAEVPAPHGLASTAAAREADVAQATFAFFGTPSFPELPSASPSLYRAEALQDPGTSLGRPWANDALVDPAPNAGDASARTTWRWSDFARRETGSLAAVSDTVSSLSGLPDIDRASALASSMTPTKGQVDSFDAPTLAALTQPLATRGVHTGPVAASNLAVTRPASPSQSKVADTYGRLPVDFEANRGQTDPQVRFLTHTSSYTLFLTATEAVMVLPKPALPAATEPDGAAADTAVNVVRMQLLGANPGSAITGQQELPGKSNYLLGNKPSQWVTDVPHYARVSYHDVYPGIDLVYHAGPQQQLEYDWVVAPGADPRTIRAAFQGAEGLRLDSQGNLVVRTGGGELTQHAPILYQEANGVPQTVAGHYALQGPQQVGFEVSNYDPGRPLVIDPVLSYSTFLGGSRSDQATALAVDSMGNAYVTGRTTSSDFPLTNPYQDHYGGGPTDAFVTELTADGSARVYSTYLGGSKADVGYGIAVDASGNAYVTGNTQSDDFPVMNALYPLLNGGNDAFVTELNSSGSGLVYSTYLGGSSRDVGNAIAVDAAGNAYVTGYTSSPDFPTGTNPPLQPNYGGGGTDAFVAEIRANGTELIYSTYLGGSSDDIGSGIAVGGDGAVYVAGYTNSSNFRVTPGAFQTRYGGRGDAFVCKLLTTGDPLVYSTFLGGSGNDAANAIAVDAHGNAYVTGCTSSTDFPLDANPLQPTYGGGNHDAFVTSLTADGSVIIYSTYLGGEGDDIGNAIAVDAAGNAYVTGYTTSTTFPTTPNALQSALGADFATNAFVTVINSTGSAWVYSSYFGGSGDDEGMGIAVDNAGKNVYLAGLTSSPDFPTANPVQPNLAGGQNAFIAKQTIIP